MISPAIVVVQIPFQRGSATRLCIPCFYAGLIIVAIARVPRGSMLRPWSHANPTEFVSAFLACHMVATAILLYGTLAFATLFRIAFNPVSRFTIILAFLEPQFCYAANQRSMIRLEWASKTKGVASSTTYSRHYFAEIGFRYPTLTFKGVNTRRCRTKFKLCLVSDVVPYHKFMETLECGVIRDLLDKRVRDCQ